MSEHLDQERLQLVRTVLKVLDDWDVQGDDQVTLLGLPANTRPRALQRYRTGMSLPDDEVFFERAYYILSIRRAVESLFPHSSIAANFWVTTDGAMHGKRSPLDIMLADGLDGMRRVLDFLDGRGY